MTLRIEKVSQGFILSLPFVRGAATAFIDPDGSVEAALNIAALYIYQAVSESPSFLEAKVNELEEKDRVYQDQLREKDKEILRYLDDIAELKLSRI